MQLMSVFAPSCFPRCPQQKCPFPIAFRAISPTLVLSVFFVKRSRCCPRIFAAKQQQEADKTVKKKSGKRRAPEKPHLDGYDAAFELEARAADRRSSHHSPLPKPPAGFVLDDHGRVLLASNNRIATIVDATNNLPLECVIRRVFQSSQGDECMLLSPVDTPVQILRSTNFNGWSANGTHYMIYTPSDPLLFVAIKDKNGILQIAEDDLLEDPAIVDAIDEETEFNALVEEEAALLASLIRDG